MKTLTPEQETKLEALWAKYSEANKATSLGSQYNDGSPSQKRTATMRFNKFTKLARSFGYDFETTYPKCMFASNK